MASKRTVNFGKRSIEKLPNDKPVVYWIETKGGKSNYIGHAIRGRVIDRIGEHLPTGKDPIPGARVKIRQENSVDQARAVERRSIAREQPRYNKQGK